MNQKYSRLKYCLFCALGIGLFLTAQSSVVSGSHLQLSYPARVVLNILSILSIALGTTIWKPKHRLAAAIRFLLAVAVSLMIVSLGFRNNQITAALPFPAA